jgi:hypothetical protein
MGGSGGDAEQTGDDARTPISFLGRRLPEWVQLHVVVIPPGCAHAFDPSCWRGALVIVERGAIDLELGNGRRFPCSQGYIGTLSGLSSLRRLHNRGDRTAVITAVSRASPHAQAQSAAGTDTSTESS